jgi:hypothetical protein
MPWSEVSHRLYGSGRDAFTALLSYGRDTLAWRRIFVPDYFCQEVVATLAEQLEVLTYPDLPSHPFRPPWLDRSLGSDCAVLVVNTFGLRTAPPLPLTRPFSIIEDHTHDPFSPWAHQSQADFGLASLRKTLPVPDGGVLWSPSRAMLPKQAHLSEIRERAAHRKLSAMLLKALYLKGAQVDKQRFRELAIAGEAEIASGPCSAITPASQAIILSAPWQRWRDQRQLNFVAFRQALLQRGGITLLVAQADACAFSCVLHFPSNEARNQMRQRLIDHRVYPAVLWPLEADTKGISEEALDFSHRMLSIHCDHRYSPKDMQRVVDFLG